MKHILNLKHLFIFAIAIIIFTGCGPSVQIASLSADMNAKKFETNKNSANIYIYRSEVFGALVAMPLTVDNLTIGTTKAKSFFNLKLNPGKHSIISSAENTDKLDLDLEANKNYFVWQEVKMGIMKARTKLHLVSNEEGIKAVKECQLLESPIK